MQSLVAASSFVFWLWEERGRRFAPPPPIGAQVNMYIVQINNFTASLLLISNRKGRLHNVIGKEGINRDRRGWSPVAATLRRPAGSSQAPDTPE